MARITGRVHLGEHRRSARQTADEPGWDGSRLRGHRHRLPHLQPHRQATDTQHVSSVPFCFVLQPSSIREGWPHHRRTFSVYLCPECPLSFWLTLSRAVLSTCPCLDVVHPGRAWSSSPACTWHCFLHYLFLQATPLFPHGVTTHLKLLLRKTPRFHPHRCWAVSLQH